VIKTKRVVETKIQTLRQGMHPLAIYATKIQQLTFDLDWNNRAYNAKVWYIERIHHSINSMPQSIT